MIFSSNFFFNLQPTQAKWRIVFVTAAAVYAGCCSFYTLFASGERQPWDNPEEDDMGTKNGAKKDPEMATTTT